MFFLIVDFILNQFFLIPSFFFVLCISRCKIDINILCGLAIDLVLLNTRYVTFVILFIYIVNKLMFKNLNLLIKDILNLFIFLVIIYFISREESVLIYFVINVSFYIICYFSLEKRILCTKEPLDDYQKNF